MKVKSYSLSRRDFLTVTTVGVALGGTWRPTSAAGAQASGTGGTGVKPTGTSRLLYVTNDGNETIDVHDTDDGHRLVRSIPWVTNWGPKKPEWGNVGPSGREVAHPHKVAGCTAHPANYIIITNRDGDPPGTVISGPVTNNYGFGVGGQLITAYDPVTGKVGWQVDIYKQGKELGYQNYLRPDRLCHSADGRALFVPMTGMVGQKSNDDHENWAKHVNLVVDATNGKVIAPPISRPGSPHNNWMGEAGLYAYLGGFQDQSLVLADQKTYKLAKVMGPFNWPIRQMVTDPEERYVYLTLTRTVGMGVGDVRTGKVLPDALVQVPKERTKNWWASGGLPHGDNPWSHGIGMRPGGSQDVWLMDDEWGYLYVFDTKKTPGRPQLKGHVPLFSNIEEPWAKNDGNRWVSFSIDGKWCYPSDGSVVDCETGKVTAMKIARSEKLCQIEFRDGKAVASTGQQGGVYGRKTT